MRLVELQLWNASWFIFWRNTGAGSAALHGSHTMAVAPFKPQTTCLCNSEHSLNLQSVRDGEVSRKELSRTAPETAAKGSIYIRVSHWDLNYSIYHSTVEDFHPHFWKSSGAHTQSFNWDIVSLIVVFLPHFSLDSDLDFNLRILYSILIEAHTTQPILDTTRSDQAQASRKNRVRWKTMPWCLMDLNSSVQRTWILCFVTSFQCSILDVILTSNRQKLKYSIQTHFANIFSNQSTNKSLNKFDFEWPNERLHNYLSSVITMIKTLKVTQAEGNPAPFSSKIDLQKDC